MKILIKLLLPLVIFFWLFFLAMIAGAPVFLQDMVLLHGSSIVGEGMDVGTPDVDWQSRILRWPHWKIKSGDGRVGNAPYIASISNVEVLLSQETSIEYAGMFFGEKPLMLDTVMASNIELLLDIDSEGADLRAIRQQISNAAGMALKDRLNASARVPTEALTPLLLVIKELRVDGVVVKAYSKDNPTKSQNFPVVLASFNNMGVDEGGITAAEIVDRVSRSMLDEVRRQAGIRGVLDAGRQSGARVADDVGMDDSAQQNGDEPGVSGKVKKAAQAVGHGFRDLGRDIKQGFKKLRD